MKEENGGDIKNKGYSRKKLRATEIGTGVNLTKEATRAEVNTS